MRKSLLAMLMAFALSFSCIMNASAVTFSDIGGSEWDWARNEINEMAAKGIIAGFPDGTYQPGTGVTKLQTMLLMSRIIGFYAPENQTIVALADEMYKNTLAQYNISNKSEIAFLLYYGVFTPEELPSYIGGTNADSVIKRYEAAVILTKTAGAEKQVKDSVMTVLPFDDTTSIPSEVRKYVAYVKEKGYMVGLTETEFGPDANVNRAQIAVMLYRIMNELNITYVSGSLVSATSSNISLKVLDETRDYAIPADAIIRLDGEIGGYAGLQQNAFVVLKSYNGSVKYVEAFSPDTDGEVSGFVTSLETGTQFKINIAPLSGGDTVKLIVPNDCKITYEGKSVSVSNIKVGDNVTIQTKDDTARSIEIKKRSSSITGASLVEVVYEPYPSVKLTTSSGLEQTLLLSDNVKVKRNGKTVTVRDLLPGDRLNITMANELVSEIDATSKKTNLTGTIESINISSSPSITVRPSNGDDESKTYAVTSETELLVDGEAATIYDLKVGFYVEITVDSDAIQKIETKSVKQVNNIIGVVESVNETYGFLYINTTDATTGESKRVQLFTKKNGSTKIIDSKDNNSSRSLKNIRQGETVLVTGSELLDGTFEASTIVIMVD